MSNATTNFFETLESANYEDDLEDDEPDDPDYAVELDELDHLATECEIQVPTVEVTTTSNKDHLHDLQVLNV